MRKSVSIENINTLPKTPGIYFLKNKSGEVFYIGKSANIKSRLNSHVNDNYLFRPEKIHKIEWINTSNEIEALLKESVYIKKYNPKMNVRLRDDKKYFYVGITDEKLPRVFITHQPDLYNNVKSKKSNVKGHGTEYIGPFTDGMALKMVLKYLRRLFSYYSTNAKRPYGAKKHSSLPCQWCHIKLCPGPEPDPHRYKKDINSIKKILQGKRTNVVKSIKKQMLAASKAEEYEKARELRDTKEALENIFEHAEITIPWNPDKSQVRPYERSGSQISEHLAELLGTDGTPQTIEGYDISNIQGKNATGSMVRFADGKPDKSMYRKFNIKAPAQPNDYKMIREVVRRRLGHPEWPYPDLILIDGGRPQLNAALFELRNYQLPITNDQTNSLSASRQDKSQFLNLKPITIAALAKQEEEIYLPNRKNPIPLAETPEGTANLLKYVRDEAHKFAVSHHRNRRRKTFKK